MVMDDFTLKLATIYNSRETGVPPQIISEMIYDALKKVNSRIKRGEVRRIVDQNLPLIKAVKKLHTLTLLNEDNGQWNQKKDHTA